MEGAVAREFDCPQCGGENPPVSGERFLNCVFCDTTLFVDRSRVVGHYRLPRLLGREEAKSALRRWMAGNDTVKDLDRKSSLESLTPATFPMWLFRTRERGSEIAYVEPAAPTAIPQLAELKVPAGELEPFSASDQNGEAIGATVPLETARKWLEERGVGAVTESSLVEVPLWRARYRYQERSYQALVEASTGRVLAAVFPEKAETPYYLVAALGLVLFGLEGLLISNPAGKLLAYLVTGVPLVLLAWWVARKV